MPNYQELSLKIENFESKYQKFKIKYTFQKISKNGKYPVAKKSNILLVKIRILCRPAEGVEKRSYSVLLDPKNKNADLLNTYYLFTNQNQGFWKFSKKRDKVTFATHNLFWKVLKEITQGVKWYPPVFFWFWKSHRVFRFVLKDTCVTLWKIFSS